LALYSSKTNTVHVEALSGDSFVSISSPVSEVILDLETEGHASILRLTADDDILILSNRVAAKVCEMIEERRLSPNLRALSQLSMRKNGSTVMVDKNVWNDELQVSEDGYKVIQQKLDALGQPLQRKVVESTDKVE
jgi:hypothetical protein